jgi:hypothetical protein
MLPWILGLLALGLVPDVVKGSPGLQVTLEQGVLKGYKGKTHSGKPFIGFRSVPYAAPPVGSLRFKVNVAIWLE